MTKSQPQTWLQTLPQSNSQRDPPAESQAQPGPRPPISISTPYPQPQQRISGVYFHGTQGVAQPLGSSQVEQLAYHILRKKQESVWGLPSVAQTSQDTFCPSPPKLSLTSQSIKAHPSWRRPPHQCASEETRTPPPKETHPAPLGPATQEP